MAGNKTNAKRRTYREELQKTMVKHAIVPCIVAIYVVVLMVAAVGLFITGHNGIKTVNKMETELNSLVMVYENKAESLAKDVSIEKFNNDTKYQVEVKAEVYHFLNEQLVRGEFFVFDVDRNLIFSTSWDKEYSYYCSSFLKMQDSTKLKEGKLLLSFGSENTDKSFIILKPNYEAGRIAGYVGFTILTEKLNDLGISEGSSVYLTNGFNRIVWSNRTDYQGSENKLSGDIPRNSRLMIYKGDWIFTRYSECMNGEVRIYVLADCTTLVNLVIGALLFTAIINLIMVILVRRSAGRLAVKKTDDIYKLIDAIEEVKNGNLEVELYLNAEDEFQSVGEDFNIMVKDIKELMHRQEELIRENTVATLKSLKTQFDAHFLFNTLTSIQYMITLEPDKATEMVANLSKLLRYSLDISNEMVPLKVELNSVANYMDIMTVRHRGRLDYTFQSPVELAQVMLPKLILQPLVENSIKHGMPDDRPLNVDITVEQEADQVIIRIMDDGKGISAEELKNRKSALEDNDQSNHIGLVNVNHRLKLSFGEQYGLNIDSTEGSGTVISINIPRG